MAWCLPFPPEIQNLIQCKLRNLYIIERQRRNKLEINQFINSSGLYDIALNMSEHIFDFHLEFECVMRIPKLEAVT